MEIAMESCNLCHEEWFDLDVTNGGCNNCRKGSTFQPSNNMYPGDGASHLPEVRTHSDGGNAYFPSSCSCSTFCGKSVVAKQNTLVILVIFLKKMHFFH